MRLALLITWAVAAAVGQSFEVASIRMYPSDAPFQRGSAGATPDGLRAQYTMLKSLLEWAYGVQEIIGPDWIRGNFDIDAKASGPVSPSQVKLMLRALLEDRFKLKVHRETQDLPAAALVVGKKGPKNLDPVQSSDPPGVQRADGKLIFRHAPMPVIAMSLGSSAPYGVGERVYDKTGLDGVFDITLDVKDFNSDHEFDLTHPGGKFQEIKSAIFVFLSTALEKEYGLKLERRKVPLQTLVVDAGNKAPTEN